MFLDLNGKNARAPFLALPSCDGAFLEAPNDTGTPTDLGPNAPKVPYGYQRYTSIPHGLPW